MIKFIMIVKKWRKNQEKKFYSKKFN